MSEQPPDPTTPAPADGRPEPEQSPQRKLVESIAAYEVDPPPPARAREPGGEGPAE